MVGNVTLKILPLFLFVVMKELISWLVGDKMVTKIFTSTFGLEITNILTFCRVVKLLKFLELNEV